MPALRHALMCIRTALACAVLLPAVITFIAALVLLHLGLFFAALFVGDER